METDKTLATIVIVGMLLFAGFTLSRVDMCRNSGHKTVTCAVGLESAQ